MGAKKSISLGDGQRIQVDFDGLKKQLKVNQVSQHDADHLLKTYFPPEFQREEDARLLDTEKKFALFNEHRWNNWFAEENRAEARRTIIFPFGMQEAEDLVNPPQYQNSHSRILQRALHAMHGPYVGDHRNYVTDFSGWLFFLDHGPAKIANLRHGKIGERLVQSAKLERHNPVPDPRVTSSDWELVHFDNLSETQPGQKISLLTVNGGPMYGLPDYVFFNRRLETILIVEVKVSDKELPHDGWANLRAQLWAYAQLDLVVKKAKQIILIGEVWLHQNGKVCRRKTYRWDSTDAQFCEENEELFVCYQQYAAN